MEFGLNPSKEDQKVVDKYGIEFCSHTFKIEEDIEGTVATPALENFLKSVSKFIWSPVKLPEMIDGMRFALRQCPRMDQFELFVDTEYPDLNVLSRKPECVAAKTGGEGEGKGNGEGEWGRGGGTHLA